MKLNELMNCNVKAYGFQALKDYAAESNGDGMDVIVSSLSPAVMKDMGVSSYYAPILPRGAVFNTADDVRNADLSVNLITVITAPEFKNAVIVSRHKGTIEVLKGMYPDAPVLDGNVTPEQIEGAYIIGTLPPHMIQYTKAYRAATINQFDYTKDGDLSGDELISRLQISDPISVIIENEPNLHKESLKAKAVYMATQYPTRLLVEMLDGTFYIASLHPRESLLDRLEKCDQGWARSAQKVSVCPFEAWHFYRIEIVK